MGMADVNFALPDELVSFVEARVVGEYADLEEYIVELVRQHHDRRFGELRPLIKSARSGLVSELTVNEIFDVAVDQVRARGRLRA